MCVARAALTGAFYGLYSSRPTDRPQPTEWKEREEEEEARSVDGGRRIGRSLRIFGTHASLKFLLG